MAAVRAEVAHRDNLMHKLRDTVAAYVSPLNAASGPRPMRTVAGLTSEAGQEEAGPSSSNLAPTLHPPERLLYGSFPARSAVHGPSGSASSRPAEGARVGFVH